MIEQLYVVVQRSFIPRKDLKGQAMIDKLFPLCSASPQRLAEMVASLFSNAQITTKQIQEEMRKCGPIKGTNEIHPKKERLVNFVKIFCVKITQSTIYVPEAI